MSRHRNPWLVAYDISSPRRLRRVHACLVRHGLPVQYSVFLVHATAAELDTLLAELEALIHPAHDDVRAYRLPPELWHRAIGAPVLPRGLLAALEGQQLTVAGGDE